MSLLLSRPTPRLTTRSLVSRDELTKLRAKMEFYEQPITTFDRPVDNDPVDLTEQRKQESPCSRSPRARPTAAAKTEAGTCFLVRFARRTVRAIRSFLTRSAERKKTTERLEVSMGKARSMRTAGSGICDEIAIALDARRLAELRQQTALDESTRFRLELAGIHVPASSTTRYTYTVNV